ncbi:MAG: serine/threonine protein kinase [Actinomycetia bacterium]|nr:serine/threonine protein kinase [Actinomycetes bacterium]
MTQPTLLGDRYELEGVVGRGGMAEVYRARDLRLDRIVAIKTLRADLARDQTFQARFRREAQSAASLNQPSIVAVYDTGEDMSTGTSIPYIVMEYVDGRTVRDLLIDGHRLLPERSLEIVSGVLRALEYSHQAGIVHRDIKPGNVMVTRNGDVKVMDFGIARAMNDAQSTMTQTAQVIGTAQYLSPEQARGERVDARSDLYSTGCLMYELLTGRPPFTGDSPVAIAYQHVRENPIPPSRLDPDIPPWADAIVLKAMAKAPGDRYQSAAEMQADIQRAASGMQVAAMAAPPTRADYYDHDYPQDRTQRMGPNTMLAGPGTGQYAQTYAGDGGGYPPQRKSWARRWLPWLIPAAVIIAVIAVAAAMLTSNGKTYFVPQVDGQSQAAAIAQLKQAGLDNYNVVKQSNGSVPKGDVISTSPPNGQSVSSAATQVTLNVSAGVGKVAVPSVTTLNQTAATTKLDNANLNVNVQPDPNSILPQGTVTKQDPVAGTPVAPGSTVTIYVSPGGVTVPSVVSLNYLKATQQLETDGLTVTSTPGSDPSSPPANPGDVYQQSIPANKVVPKGTAITLTYEMAATPSPTPSPTPSDTTSPSPTSSPTSTSGSSTPPPSPTNTGGLPGGF